MTKNGWIGRRGMGCPKMVGWGDARESDQILWWDGAKRGGVTQNDVIVRASGRDRVEVCVCHVHVCVGEDFIILLFIEAKAAA